MTISEEARMQISERALPCRRQPLTKTEALFKFFRLSHCVLISESSNS